jgi:hypothetical protein
MRDFGLSTEDKIMNDGWSEIENENFSEIANCGAQRKADFAEIILEGNLSALDSP